MSASDFIGALAGSRARYALRSRLNSGVRMSPAPGAAGAVIGTVVAPSAWMAATAARYWRVACC